MQEPQSRSVLYNPGLLGTSVPAVSYWANRTKRPTKIHSPNQDKRVDSACHFLELQRTPVLRSFVHSRTSNANNKTLKPVTARQFRLRLSNLGDSQVVVLQR